MLFASVSSIDCCFEIPKEVDGIELRLDRFSTFDSLSDFIESGPLPTLFTLRRSDDRTEEEREALVKQFMKLKPTYFDLEFDMRPEFLDWAFAQESKIILSYHNFDQTPVDLAPIFASMKLYPAFMYKMATFATTATDALRLLDFGRNYPNLSVLSMGDKGSFARVLAPIFGNQIDFGFVDHPTAPGQLSIHELITTYHYHQLNQATTIYGLIGSPVTASLGHQFHNGLFVELQINAVYVKIDVSESELSTFLPLAKQIGFRGLSVTMPLKEKVMPALGAVNTLFLGEIITGLSVDGLATLDAIGDVQDQDVVILGAGGSAKAIALEAKKRGANVTILNRTVAKALAIASEVDGKSGLLSEMPIDYAVLINCTPCPMPIDARFILASATIVDLVYSSKMTPFLQAAATLGCKLVFGRTIFELQAKAQFDLWHKS